ncbi:MAG: leucine-rich repeat domain-containing protein [Candidatus Coproplasma sp.]
MTAAMNDEDFVIADGVLKEYRGNESDVAIPDGVKSIGDRAFSFCDNLTGITIPNSVKSIGEYAFSDCGNLTSITIPSSVKSIGDYAFSDCRNLTSITVLSGVKNIGENAFSFCKKLKNVTIPEGVKSIGYSAFSYCDNLTSVIIPDGVKYIGVKAFDGCINLKEVTMPKAFKDKKQNIFAKEICGLFSKCKFVYTDKVILNSADDTEDDADYLAICFGEDAGKNEEALNKSIFSASMLSELTLKRTEAEIKEEEARLKAEEQAEMLAEFSRYSLVVGGVLKRYGSLCNYAVIPEGITAIGDYAFGDCKNLKGVTIPESVKRIGEGAFLGCIGLTSITIPKDVKYILKYAFGDCFSLIEIKNLSSLNVTAGSQDNGCVGYNAKRVYSEGESYLSTDKDGYIIYNDETDKILVKYTGRETELTLPGGITEINQCAFYNRLNVKSIIIPDGVTEIGNCAFWKCSGLTVVTIPKSVKNIGDRAFANCTSLTRVKLPKAFKDRLQNLFPKEILERGSKCKFKFI